MALAPPAFLAPRTTSPVASAGYLEDQIARARPLLRSSKAQPAAAAAAGGSLLPGVGAAALGAGLGLGLRSRRARAGRRARDARGSRGPVLHAAKLEASSCQTAFLFPGQGAQSVGMCKELVEECPAARVLFDKASAILGYDLLDRCTNGPAEVLNTTAVSQPAIFVASMAAVEKLRQDQGDSVIDSATVAMGLSLGEYSALCFAGALDFEDGVRITKARGEAMQAAADAVDSGMVSVVGLDKEKTEELCRKASEDTGKKVQVANYLCKGNYTVSGDKEACARVVEIAKPEFKARMATPLAVAGAFHTDFMAPAVNALKQALASANIKSPRIPVVSNVDAQTHDEPDEIRAILTQQVTAPVQWEQQVKSLIAGNFEKGFELGPGTVIAGIVKRIDKKAAAAITNVTV
eukprot:TRINITY_DN30382_c0_g1_i1.p1 TRINITY_DN30382_c0_g1~~TRINITY_DN30382_c0_g1_i1.p1  ORF type:complete len:426 (-),score=105.01 TRINITY_DN30382_c0_g1_i1:50-1270(-)